MQSACRGVGRRHHNGAVSTYRPGFERLVELGMVDRADLELFGFAEDAEGIWAELLARGLEPRASIDLADDQNKP